MPKVPRSQEDREIIREKILDEALTLISEHGFTSFSMRKLASRLGLTATTIYNYYSNKDELYMMILTRGFEMLHERFEKISMAPGSPAQKLKDMVRAYIDFGIHKAHYYNIMFTSDAPKYRDYIGTDIEPVAYMEKQTALKLIDVVSRTLQEFILAGGCLAQGEVRYFIIKLWSTLHGIIALYNSRVLPEVDENPEQIIEHVAEDVLRPILSRDTVKTTGKTAGAKAVLQG
jgi:AcrR family transcriptional regulator